MECQHCTTSLDGLEHCHATSIEHADGTTECLSDSPCGLGHDLHDWRLRCSEVDPGCACARTETAPALDAAGGLAAAA